MGSHSDSEQRNKKGRKFKEKKKHPYKKGGRARTLSFSEK
jgi:hypothetical protein